MSNPTPAAVFRKAREHDITRAEAKRIIAATERVQVSKATQATK